MQIFKEHLSDMVLTLEFNSWKHVNTVLKKFHLVMYHMFEAWMLKVKKCYIKTGMNINHIWKKHLYDNHTHSWFYSYIIQDIVYIQSAEV